MRDTPPVGVTTVVVVVPARNEEARLARCLDSLTAAISVLARGRPDITTSVTVTLHRCRDGSADVTARYPQVQTTVLDTGHVGAARQAGVSHAVAKARPVDATRVLVVNTDADCVAPRDWLVDLVRLAEGHDVVLGRVTPHPEEMTPGSLARWIALDSRVGVPVHGANLAVRLHAYLGAGGFPDLAAQEDLALVDALQARQATVTVGTTVVTSGRRRSRVPAGFAGYLRDLDAALASTSLRDTAVDREIA